MSLSTFLNEVINVDKECSSMNIFIVDDNARLGNDTRSNNFSCCSYEHGAYRRDHRRSNHLKLQTVAGVCEKKVHPSLLRETTKSDTSLSMPQREDSMTSLTSDNFGSGQQLSDRWSPLMSKSDSSPLTRKSHLHAKWFGDSALSIPSRLMSPSKGSTRHARISGAKKKVSTSDDDIRKRMMLITQSALAIVSESLEEIPIMSPLY